MITNTAARFPISIDEQEEIRQVSNFKYLGALVIDTDGIGTTEMRHGVEQSRVWGLKHGCRCKETS